MYFITILFDVHCYTFVSRVQIDLKFNEYVTWNVISIMCENAGAPLNR